MKKTMKKAICTLLTSAMLVSALAGCGATNTNSTEGSSAGNSSEVVQPSTSESVATQPVDEKVDYDVTLKWLTQGQDGTDRKQVLDKINEILDEKLGVTLEVEYFTDAEGHSLAVATGKDLDIVTSHGWLDYELHVDRGAYAELTDEDLMTYAPAIWEFGEKTDVLESTKIDGKRYAIGRTAKLQTPLIAYRGDLADKYGIGNIETFDDLEKYLYAIAENEPNMQAWDLDGGSWWYLTALYLSQLEWVGIGSVGYGFPVYIDSNEENPKVFLATERPEYLEFVTKMHEWYEAGIFSKSVLSSSVNQVESFKAGRGGLCRSGNYADPMQSILDEFQQDERKEWDVRFCPFYFGFTAYSSSRHGSIGVSAFSDNKEAALATLNEIFSNEELYDLFAYGIEGLNYNKDEEGRYIAVSDESFGYWDCPVKNDAFIKETVVYTISNYEELLAHYQDITTSQLSVVTPLVTDEISSIVTAVTEVSGQYKGINSFGAFDGTPEEAVAAELAAYKAAGIDEYIRVYQEQLDAWLKSAKGE